MLGWKTIRNLEYVEKKKYSAPARIYRMVNIPFSCCLLNDCAVILVLDCFLKRRTKQKRYKTNKVHHNQYMSEKLTLGSLSFNIDDNILLYQSCRLLLSRRFKCYYMINLLSSRFDLEFLFPITVCLHALHTH